MKMKQMLKGLCIVGIAVLTGLCGMSVSAGGKSPVLKVTFDEGSAQDSSGNGNHGTVAGAPEFVEGMSGKAIHLVNGDGIAAEYVEASQYVNFGTPDDLKFGTEDFSVMFWYKSDGADPEEVAIISNKDWYSGGNEGITIADFRNGMGLNFTAQGSGRIDTGRMTEATDNKWHHIAAVFDRSGDMALYIDGQKATSSDISGEQGKTIDVTDFVLGADGKKHYGVKDSYIDELEVYKCAFTAEEIKAMDAPYQLQLKIAAYEAELAVSQASEEKRAAFEKELNAVKRESAGLTDPEAVSKLLERLTTAYNLFVKPEKGIVEFEALSDVHIKKNDFAEDNSVHFIDALQDIQELFPETLGVMNSGDFTDYGTEDQFKGYYNILEQYGGDMEFMTALGNHDVRWKSGWTEIYDRYMEYNKPYMGDTDKKVYFDKWLGGYHFVVVNTEWDLKDRAYISDEQIQWLDKTLSENSSPDKPIFIFFHQAMRDTYFNSNEWSIGVQDHKVKEVLRKYPQVIMFTGHIHNGLGACKVIETDYGSMVDVPSLYYNDGGGQSRGQIGYHVSVYEDSVQLSMYDYMNDVWLPEYNYTISTKPEDKPRGKALEVNFDDETARDVSGNGNDGVISGDPKFVDGISGKAIRLVNEEGVAGENVKAQQYVEFGENDSLRLGIDDFSILFWYKGEMQDWGDYCVLSNKNWDTGGNPGFAIGSFSGTNGGIGLNFTAEGESRIDTSRYKEALDGSWHQIAATYDRDGEMTVYIDGKKAGSKDISGQAGKTIDVDALGLVLGADGNLKYGVRDLCIDELSVYRCLIGPGEVETLYQPYYAEPGVKTAKIYWESEENTEPAYLVLDGVKYKDIPSGASSITVTGLEPDTEYTAMVVTRERSNSGNYQDGFTVKFRTSVDLEQLQKELEEQLKAAEEAKEKAKEEQRRADEEKKAAEEEKARAEAEKDLAREKQAAADEALKKALETQKRADEAMAIAEKARKEAEEAKKKYEDALKHSSGKLKEGETYKKGNFKYKVTDAQEAAVTLTGTTSKKLKKAVIQAYIMLDGVKCRVTEIGAKAFQNQKYLTKVTIGANVEKIGTKAFYGGKKLKQINIKSAKLRSVGKNAFKNISAKAVIKVPKEKKSVYSKLLNNKGQKKTVKIK
ncbi:MAG: LamG-like jellyroll fold domain-containing protein [Lachnospiraceae bacterium]|jgi:hypothetical protein|nr:LamG-like jellyroll fold domain-containing protein [Lachnospiraceae bacterium]